jgi:hypothetical protein
MQEKSQHPQEFFDNSGSTEQCQGELSQFSIALLAEMNAGYVGLECLRGRVFDVDLIKRITEVMCNHGHKIPEGQHLGWVIDQLVEAGAIEKAGEYEEQIPKAANKKSIPSSVGFLSLLRNSKSDTNNLVQTPNSYIVTKKICD